MLIAVPNLVGALIRLPYTFAVPKFGGRNWTVVSALLLLVPTLLFAWSVQRPETPYWVFLVIAATAGLGGGNFASSMANINFFYPTSRKGTALGLNAAGGNLGVAVIQLFLPIVVGGAGIFGLVQASSGGLHLERAGYLYAALALVAAGCAFRFMNNLTTARSSPREQLSVVRSKHTWVMSFLYIGTFGSFIGYSAAMPLLIKLNFSVTDPATGVVTGINFAYYAFLGALVGSVARPFGGWLADKYGGARVTFWTFAAMIVGTLAVLWTLSQLTPNPTQSAAIASDNQSWFPWFLAAFLLVFAATGIGNGSTYRMIPLIVAQRGQAHVHRRHLRHGHGASDQARQRGDRHRRRGRRARRLPDPDDLRGAVDRRPGRRGAGRVPGVHHVLRGLPAGHLVRLHPPVVPGRAGAEPGRRRGLTWRPRRRTAPTARCSAACAWSGRGRRRSRRGRSSRSTGRACAARAGPPPGCSRTASG